MHFSEYQEKSRVTATYPDVGDNFIYPTLGLVGEAGEFAEKIKKLMRDQGVNRPSEVTEEVKAEVLKELGDVLWYASQLASEFDVDLSQVAEQNIEKLYSRMDRGVLGGSGDNR